MAYIILKVSSLRKSYCHHGCLLVIMYFITSNVFILNYFNKAQIKKIKTNQPTNQPTTITTAKPQPLLVRTDSIDVSSAQSTERQVLSTLVRPLPRRPPAGCISPVRLSMSPVTVPHHCLSYKNELPSTRGSLLWSGSIHCSSQRCCFSQLSGTIS